MQSILIIVSILIGLKYDEPEDIDYSYLDNQISISMENFENEYEEYQEYYKTHYFKGEHVDDIAKK